MSTTEKVENKTAKVKKEKVKKVKRPTTKFDIFSRIITCLAAVAIPVVAYFTNIIYYVVESPVFALYAKIKGDTTDDGSTYGLLGIHKFIRDYLPLIRNLSSDKVDWGEVWNSLELVRTGLILTSIFFVLAVIVGIVIFFISAFSNSNKAPMITALIGFLFTLGMYFSFRGISLPITMGAIDLSDFFESSIIASLMPFLASFSQLKLGTAWVLMMVLFIGIFIWHGALLLIGNDEKEKKVK